MKRYTMVLLTLLVAAAPAPAAYMIGDTVSDFTLPGLDGGDHSLSDLRGEIVVLNFFATWCLGCNEEAEHLENDIWQVYGSQGVRVVAVDIMEQAVLVDGWRQAQGVTYDIWLAPDWDLFQLFTEFGGIPYNTVIDRDGILRYSQTGFDLTAIVDTVESLLDTTPNEIRAWSDVKSLYAR